MTITRKIRTYEFFDGFPDPGVSDLMRILLLIFDTEWFDGRSIPLDAVIEIFV